MKKVIFGLIASLTFINIISCIDKNDIEVTNSDKIISEVLNQKNVYNFVKKHVELNDKIILVLENETKLNNEILFKNSFINCNNKDEFKNILEKSGIVKINELSELISLQVQNSKNFQSVNPAFFSLNKLEQEKLLTKYVDEILNENSMGLNGKSNKKNNYAMFSCASQYTTAKNRCNRDLNLHGTFAIIGCFSGPWTCAVGSVLVLAEHANCMEDAKEDYEACLNN